MEAAALADVLMYRNSFGEIRTHDAGFGESDAGGVSSAVHSG